MRGDRRHARPSYESEASFAGILPRERLWIRGAAFGVDLLILAGVPLLLATTVIFGILLASPDPPLSLSRGFRAAQLVFLLLFAVRDTGGASPGKRLFGLHIAREDRASVTVLTSVLRNLPLLVPGWNLVETLSVFGRPDGRRFGDRLSRTAVVET